MSGRWCIADAVFEPYSRTLLLLLLLLLHATPINATYYTRRTRIYTLHAYVYCPYFCTTSPLSPAGHRVKSVSNPDKRVVLVKEYAKAHFPGGKTPLLDYALAVEAITTQKKE